MMNKLFVVLGLLLLGRAAAGDLLGGAWTLYAEQHNATLTQTGGVLRIEVRRPSEPFYLTQVNQGLATPLPAGRKLQLSFQARAAAGNTLRALLEQNVPPYVAVIASSPTLGPDWKTYRQLEVTERDWPAGSLGVRFQVGQQAGMIELRAIALEDMGPDARFVAAQAALAPDQIAARIRQHRMADLRIEVRDGAGRPVPNATVRIEQQRHAFLFGANIFELKPDDNSPQQRAYQEQFAALLNYATLPFYWGAFEPQRGQPHDAQLEKMARWCQARGIACKGHPLVWHEVWPAWAPADADAAIPLLRARVFDLIPRYRETIRYWDVLNEANSAMHYPKTGEGQWIRRDGPAAVVATALGWAREANRAGGATLLYNDYNTGSDNEALLRALRDKQALPDAIGIQSHMHGGLWPLPQAWNVAERFAAFGRPVHFTEMTIVSGPEPKHAPEQDWVPNWVTTPAGEAAQARYVAELYTVLFSHPALEAITWWDFSDHNAWKGAPAGFVRKDMTPKPIYDALRQLIRETWWTRATATADTRGAAQVRVFRGTHTVTARDAAGHTNTQSVELPISCAEKTVTLQLK
jgi:GH35 family endo-1,4-beta-xylanase